MRATILVCALAACLAPGALGNAVNVIHQYNPYYNDPNNPGYPFYEVIPGFKEVRIYHGELGQTFQFEAALEDNGVYQDPGDIRSIIAEPYAGTVALTIVGQPGHDYGARDVGSIKINFVGVTGTVERITISGDLNGYADTQANAAGALDIGGDVLHDILVTQDIGPVLIGGVLDGDIRGHPLVTLTVVGSPTAIHHGSIEVTTNVYAEVLHIGGSMGPTSEIWLHGGLGPAATVEVTGDIPGLLRIPLIPRYASVSVGGGGGVCWVHGECDGTLAVGSGDSWHTNLFIDWEVGRFASITATGGLAWAQFSGPFLGTMTVTGPLAQCDFNGLSGSGSSANIQATGIGTLTSVDAINGMVDAGSMIGSAWLQGGMGTHGTLTTTGSIGDVTVFGALGGTLHADGGLTGRLGGDAQHACTLTASGSIELGSLPGAVELDDHTAGWIAIHGDASGTVEVKARSILPDDPNSDLSGSITVDGALSGWIHLVGSVGETGSIYVGGVLDDAGGNLSGGHITIGRSLRAGATITVAPGQDFDPVTEFVTARFNGWAADESGYAIDPDATVTIGNHPPCHGDCPEVNVRAVSSCRADMSNNGVVDFDDIDPFIEALTSDPADYSIAHPGLGGTAANYAVGGRLFHGDCNCNGLFGFDDINPFVARLSNGCCSPSCEPCGGDFMAAPQLAAGMRAHVPVARMPALRAFVAQAIAHHQAHGDLQQRAYWAQVLARLNQ